MDDVVGLLLKHGVGGLNSVLMAVLYLLIRNRLMDMEAKLTAVYEWHLVQKGKEEERDRQEES